MKLLHVIKGIRIVHFYYSYVKGRNVPFSVENVSKTKDFQLKRFCYSNPLEIYNKLQGIKGNNFEKFEVNIVANDGVMTSYTIRRNVKN